MAIFSNQATLSYNGISVNSNTVTGNIIEVLSVTKTALTESYSSDSDITYIISLNNSGALPFTDLTLTDNLGAYSFGAGTVTPLTYVSDSAAFFVNGIFQNKPVPSSQSPLIFNGITVPAGGNAMIIYEAKSNEFAPLSSQSEITNSVSVTGTGIVTPLIATETVTADETPLLSIAKALNPVNVAENGALTYTFTIQNTGNAPALATDNVIITDIFNPVLNNITVTVNGEILAPSEYTYDEATGEFATLPGVITVNEATFTQNPVTGVITVNPSSTVVTVSGTI